MVQEAQRKAAICPVGGGIRAAVSNSHSVAPGRSSSVGARGPPRSGARSPRPSRGLHVAAAAGESHLERAAAPLCQFSAARGRCAGVRVPAPAADSGCRAPRSGRARRAASTRSRGRARAKRRSQGHRAGGVGSRRAEEADFLGLAPWGYHGVWEESPGSLCDFCGPPHR